MGFEENTIQKNNDHIKEKEFDLVVRRNYHKWYKKKRFTYSVHMKAFFDMKSFSTSTRQNKYNTSHNSKVSKFEC